MKRFLRIMVRVLLTIPALCYYSLMLPASYFMLFINWAFDKHDDFPAEFKAELKDEFKSHVRNFFK